MSNKLSQDDDLELLRHILYVGSGCPKGCDGDHQSIGQDDLMRHYSRGARDFLKDRGFDIVPVKWLTQEQKEWILAFFYSIQSHYGFSEKVSQIYASMMIDTLEGDPDGLVIQAFNEMKKNP